MTLIDDIKDADIDIDFKGVLTVSIGLFTIFGITKATKLWKDGDSALAGPAVRLLALNAVLVVLLTIYKLTRREIAPLFVLQCLSHYTCFLVFAALSGYGSHPKIKKGGRIDSDQVISMAIWALHGLYALVLILGTKWAECTEGNVYPISFAMSNILFLVSYGMLLYVKKRGFDVNDLHKKDDDAGSQEDLELFEAQIAAFFSAMRTLVIWHAVEMVLGFVFFNVFFEEAVTCDESLDAWVFNFKAGKLFILLHILGVNQGLSVPSKVFSATVVKLDKLRAAEDAKKKEE